MANFRQGPFQSLPVVVKNIIIICVLMVLAQFVLIRMGINMSDYLGLHYWQSPGFRWWQFFTHMFMHGSPTDLGLTIGHIFFNMFGLWMFGSILENLWGAKRFLIFYLVCGLGAAFCHLGILTIEFSSFHNAFVQYQQHPGYVEFVQFVKHYNFPVLPKFISDWGSDQGNPAYVAETIKGINEYYSSMTDVTMVGASGAIFGLLFAFAYTFPNAELYILFIPIPVKAKWAVAGYAAIELFSGIGEFKGDNVAHFAHLGGMLFAFILLRIWKFNGNNRVY